MGSCNTYPAPCVVGASGPGSLGHSYLQRKNEEGTKKKDKRECVISSGCLICTRQNERDKGAVDEHE